jgi:hypothetical protein
VKISFKKLLPQNFRIEVDQMTDESRFDPGKVEEYIGPAGRTFVTKGDSLEISHTISPGGKFESNNLNLCRVEGAEVELVAGIPEAEYRRVKNAVESRSKQRFDEVIREYGQEPGIGHHLAVSFDDESYGRTKCFGLLTGKQISRII